MFNKKIGFFSAIILLAGCGKESTHNQVEKHEASLYVVNVLDQAQYNDAHIKGSINIQLQELEEKVKDWNKDATVVFYCSNYMCTASGQAAKMLTALGFKDTRAFEGGMAEWYQLHKDDAEYALVGKAQDGYLTMVIKKPATEPAGVQIIDAKELKKLMKKANLL
jgi:rhodanese-related sulfurtransferase